MYKKIIIMIFSLQLLLVGVQFGMSFKKATDGDKITDIENKITKLNKENSVLLDRFHESTTISKIVSYAQSNQMIPANISYLEPASVAIKP